MVIFHSYVKLPEGISKYLWISGHFSQSKPVRSCSFRFSGVQPPKGDGSSDRIGPQCKNSRCQTWNILDFFWDFNGSMVFLFVRNECKKFKHVICCASTREGMCLLAVLSKLWAMRRICKNAWQAWDNSYLKQDVGICVAYTGKMKNLKSWSLSRKKAIWGRT